MGFAQLKNKFASYFDGEVLYDHIEYGNISDPGAEYQIHDVYEIIFLKKGSITYTVEGRSYRVKNGSIIFTHSGQWHSLLFEDTSIYERYDITFDKKILSPEMQQKLSFCPEVTEIGDYTFINEIFQRMDYYCKYLEGEDLKNILCHLTEEIICNIILVDKVFSKNGEETRYSANRTVIKAVEYIEKNIDKNFTLDELCQELFITKSHLHRLFSEHLKITPKKYINSKRLILAQKLLRRGAKPASVFTECGFAEYSTFWRDYKKYFGYSPSEESEHTVERKIEF